MADFHLAQDMQKTNLMAANEIGYPAVLKIATTKGLHKTERKGVKIDIQDDRTFQTAEDAKRLFIKIPWRRI